MASGLDAKDSHAQHFESTRLSDRICIHWSTCCSGLLGAGCAPPQKFDRPLAYYFTAYRESQSLFARRDRELAELPRRLDSKPVSQSMNILTYVVSPDSTRRILPPSRPCARPKTHRSGPRCSIRFDNVRPRAQVENPAELEEFMHDCSVPITPCSRKGATTCCCDASERPPCREREELDRRPSRHPVGELPHHSEKGTPYADLGLGTVNPPCPALHASLGVRQIPERLS
jgi:hypothetical protein